MLVSSSDLSLLSDPLGSGTEILPLEAQGYIKARTAIANQDELLHQESGMPQLPLQNTSYISLQYISSAGHMALSEESHTQILLITTSEN